MVNTGLYANFWSKKHTIPKLRVCAIRGGPSTPNSFAVSPMIPPKKTKFINSNWAVRRETRCFAHDYNVQTLRLGGRPCFGRKEDSEENDTLRERNRQNRLHHDLG